MKPDRTGRVWDEVRRTLGRMVGHVTSHAVPEAHTGIAVVVRHPEATAIADPLPGARQAEWQPTASVYTPAAPTVQAGAEGIDLAAVTTVIGADRSLGAVKVEVSAMPCVTTQPQIHVALLAQETSVAPTVHVAPMRLTARPALDSTVTFASPAIRALSGAWALSPKITTGRQVSGWQFRTGRVGDGLSTILRMPLKRERLPIPNGVSPAAAFTAERGLLAAAAGVPETDVALIGVFPQVPLEAIQRLAMAPSGTALEIWVRPEAAGRARPVSVVTVVLGRQRSTGKTLQTVRREDGSGQGRQGA